MKLISFVGSKEANPPTLYRYWQSMKKRCKDSLTYC